MESSIRARSSSLRPVRSLLIQPILFVSDVHLTARDPAGVARFVEFLRGPCRGASRVVIAGDLFDYWVNAGQLDAPELRDVFDEFRALTSNGVDVGFVRGNRDFNAGRDLSGLGVTQMPDAFVVDAFGLRVACTHGDLLCTGDVGYQALRRLLRGRLIAHLMRVLPHSVSNRVGRGARAGSQMKTANYAYDRSLLRPPAVAAFLRQHDAHALVCGHVHWGERFVVDVDGQLRDVVVLDAWESRPTYAELGPDGLAFRVWG